VDIQSPTVFGADAELAKVLAEGIMEPDYTVVTIENREHCVYGEPQKWTLTCKLNTVGFYGRVVFLKDGEEIGDATFDNSSHRIKDLCSVKSRLPDGGHRGWETVHVPHKVVEWAERALFAWVDARREENDRLLVNGKRLATLNGAEYYIPPHKKSICCLACGRTSWNVHDMNNLYCAFCEKTHTAVDG